MGGVIRGKRVRMTTPDTTAARPLVCDRRARPGLASNPLPRFYPMSPIVVPLLLKSLSPLDIVLPSPRLM